MNPDFPSVVKDKPIHELLKMVYEFDQWSPEMLSAVEQELSNRNLLPADLQERKQQAIEAEDIELSKGKEASTAGQVFGWISILLGFVGIIIGYHYAYSKVRSKYTGEIYFKYNKESRKTGEQILLVSIIIMIISILIRMNS